MELVNFNDYPGGDINYGGSERKKSILVPQGNGEYCDYMLKFRKDTAFGSRFNHISEYLGSHIFELLGFEVQKTFLGLFDSREVVACRNFLCEGEQFVPFNDVGESTLEQDRDLYQYEYEDIMRMLRDNSKLVNIDETIDRFWDIFIVDAFLGNFDRHGANWGFVKRENTYRLAPVFDNGSCLFPNMTDEEEMRAVIGSKAETQKRVATFPTSQIKLHGRKSSYLQVISSLEFAECNNALMRIVPRVDMDSIRYLVETVPNITQIHKDFYLHMLYARYEAILASPLRECRSAL